MKPKIYRLILLLLVAGVCAAPLLAQTPAASEAQKTSAVEKATETENAPAAEKFGENDRIPFMQAEEAARPDESSSGGLLARTFGAMLLIVGLIFAGAWGLKKFGFGAQKAKADADVPDLSILSSVSLGGGRSISAVRFGERVLLVGSTAQAFTLLADETGDERNSNLNPRSVADLLAEENSSFADKLDRAENDLGLWRTGDV